MPRIDELQTERMNERQKIQENLLRIDILALKKLEAQFQGIAHKALYGTDLTDKDKVLDCHGKIKYAHQFVSWIENELNTLKNGTEA